MAPLEHKEKQLADLAKVINFIITCTHHHTYDEATRQQIATSIKRCIVMSKNKGGNVEIPEDTAIYKIALSIKNAKNYDEFVAMIKNGTPKFTPIQALSSYNLKWKTSFCLPEQMIKDLAIKKEMDPGLTIIPQQSSSIKMLDIIVETELNSLKEQLRLTTEALEKLTEFVINHVHGDIVKAHIQTYWPMR